MSLTTLICSSYPNNLNNSLLPFVAKDNSNRLWDLRQAQVQMKFKGHQNSRSNFIRAKYGPEEKVVHSGSEDGSLYVWDVNNGQVISKLHGHSGIVYGAEWNAQSALLASYSQDSSVQTWRFEPSNDLSHDSPGY